MDTKTLISGLTMNEGILWEPLKLRNSNYSDCDIYWVKERSKTPQIKCKHKMMFRTEIQLTQLHFPH